MRTMLRRALAALALLLLTLHASAARADDPPATALSAARLGRGGGALPQGRALAVRYDGEVQIEGHFERPHATRTYHSTRRITVTAPGNARQDWTTWQDGDSSRSVESTLLLGGRVLHRDDASAPWTELSGRAAGTAAWLVWSAVPALVSTRGQDLLGHGLLGGAVNDFRSRYAWPDPLGAVTVELDVMDAPIQVQVASTDPWHGSVLNECRYFGVAQQGANTWPDSIATIAYPEGELWRLRERRTELVDAAPLVGLSLPDSVRPAAPARTDTIPVTRVLAPHVWAIELPDAETQSLVLEFADHLVVLETSCDVPHGERLKAAAAGLSKKPVRYVAFSHHHPDYVGGLRPFIADTATVVCARSNKPYVDEIAHWSFQLDADRLWKRRPGGLVPHVDTLTAGRWNHADAMNELVAIDIGQKSHHTDAYLVFWLPRAKLLFEGDLGWFAAPGGPRASSRAAGLLEAIDAAKLAPARLVQSWTPGATPHEMPMRAWRALVAARAGR